MTLLHAQTKRRLPVLLGLTLAGSGLSPAHAAKFEIIYRFDLSGAYGASPTSGLTTDSAGKLVGATPVGGTGYSGVVFRLSAPVAAGAPWTEEVLFDFGTPAGQFFSAPFGPEVLASDTTIFGTAASGGPAGNGMAYRLDDSGAGWALTVLHAFAGPLDGSDTYPGLTFGPAGLLYGPTEVGGAYGGGTLYSLSADGDRAGYKRVAVGSVATSGSYIGPSRPIATGSNRLFYTTQAGGANGTGAVYSARVNGHSVAIYNFRASGDARSPAPDSPLALAPDHTLLGCADGGQFGMGAVYRLTPPAASGGAWTEAVLYSFGAQPSDPFSSAGRCYLAVDKSGRIAGVSAEGGSYGEGTLFKLDPPASAGSPWTEAVLHSFNGHNSLWLPQGVPVKIGDTYYGTAMFGYECLGGVWSFTP